MNRPASKIAPALGLVLGFCCSAGWTMWAKLSDADLIASSSVIVRAELIDKVPFRAAPDQPPLRLGILAVEKVFKGKPELKIALLVLPGDGLLSSSRVDYATGSKGIWFLREDGDPDSGAYLADNPQRLWPLDQERRLLDALGK